MKLTDMTVRTLPIPERGQRDFWDTTLPAFGVRVSQGGTRTFVLMKDGSRKSLGCYPIISLAQARELARAILAQRALGLSSISYLDALELFLKTHCKGLRTAKEYERLLRKHFPFTKPLAQITTREIVDILDTLPPITANNAFARLRTLMRWAKARRYIQHSPCEGLPRPHKAVSRDRVLSPDEIKAVWQSTATELSFDRIVRICLLLALRRGEAASIQPDWLQGDTLVVPATHTKNKHELILPLTPGAYRLIATYAAASSRRSQRTWSKPKAVLDAKSGVTDWVLHDLRRSVASHISAPPISAPPHLVDRLLNHKSSTLHRTYNRYEYLSELRQLLSAWEAQLLAMVGEQA